VPDPRCGPSRLISVPGVYALSLVRVQFSPVAVRFSSYYLRILLDRGARLHPSLCNSAWWESIRTDVSLTSL